MPGILSSHSSDPDHLRSTSTIKRSTTVGGQQKRLALANVPGHEHDQLLLYEPTNHLDLK